MPASRRSPGGCLAGPDGAHVARQIRRKVDYWEFLDAIDPESTVAAPQRARAYLKVLRDYRGSLAESIDALRILEHRDHAQATALKAAIDLAYDLTTNQDDADRVVVLLDKAITFDPGNEPMYQHAVTPPFNATRRSQPS